MSASTRWRWSASWMRANAPRYEVRRSDKTWRFVETRAQASNARRAVSSAAVAASAAAVVASVAAASAEAAASPASAAAHPAPPPLHLVFTVHGYVNMPRPFMFFGAPLKRAGFKMVDFAYFSGETMDDIAAGLNERIREELAELKAQAAAKGEPLGELTVSFVCHSMGGLVVRTALNADFPLPLSSIGRVVMIATPNTGSELARGLHPTLKSIVLGFAKFNVPWSAWVRGVRPRNNNSSPVNAADNAASDVFTCGNLLMTHEPDWFRTHIPLPRSLYPRTLVIAGTLSIQKGFSPSADDGTITFEETKLPQPLGSAGDDADLPAFVPSSSHSPVSAGPGGSQHMSFHAAHSQLVMHPGVIRTIIKFLQTGNAEPEAEAAEEKRR